MSFSRALLAEDIAIKIKKGATDGLAESVAAYLIEKGKTSEINSLERDIIQKRSDDNGVVELTAITAHSISSEQIAEIQYVVKKVYPASEEVIVNQQLDRSVVGGIRLELANQLLDLSAQAKLSQLRKLTS